MIISSEQVEKNPLENGAEYTYCIFKDLAPTDHFLGFY